MFKFSNTRTFHKRKWSCLKYHCKKYITCILFIIFSLNIINCTKRKTNDYIVIYGDTRSNHSDHQKVVNAIEKVNPSDIFHVGDLVNDGLIPSEWVIFNMITTKIRKYSNFYPALGNHDSDSKFYFDNFQLPGNERYYSVAIGLVQFIILDSNSPYAESKDQIAWLKKNLKNIPDNIQFRIVIFHHPPYTSGSHGNETRLQKIWIPIFEKNKIDMVFNGHDHNYEKLYKNGIYYIVTGGGGAPLRDKITTNPYSIKFVKTLEFCRLSVNKNQLMLKVLNPKLKIIDSIVINK